METDTALIPVRGMVAFLACREYGRLVMTVGEPLPRFGGAARWTRGLLVTLCAVLAVLLHHELPDAPVTTMSASAAHTMPGSPSLPAAHSHTGSPAAAGAVVHGSDGAACPSMAMQLCTAAGVHVVQLTAPPESPAPAFSVPVAVHAGVDAARSVSRAPPDLSLISLLRI
ncbi:hypothetical protein M2158_000180 [Streptomyces sp. SAI-144]|nr:hypothetical protein [Streptomyces sp. SAI-144]MDH6492941.1 hypothetical protein [Streptomyces sp. SAI-127]